MYFFVIFILYIEEENLRAVTDKFNSISAKYYQFGSNLKISPGVLDGIRNEISVHDLLQEVVREFLQNPREKFKPTWRTIVDAVFDINPALAKEIAEKHLGMLCRLKLIFPCSCHSNSIASVAYYYHSIPL